MNYQRVIFYSRPWEVYLHCEIAKLILEHSPDINILFVSYFSQAIEIAKKQGFSTAYVPELLNKVGDNRLTDKRFIEIDRYFEQRYVGLNKLINTERFLPISPQSAEEFLIKHLTVLDNLVAENTLGISSMFDHFFYVAAGLLSFMKGGCHFAFVGCGVPSGRVIGLKTPWETWEAPVSETDAESLFKISQEEVRLPSEQRIEYMKPASPIGQRSFGQRLSAIRKRRKFASQDHRNGSYFPNDQRLWPLNALRFRWKKAVIKLANYKWDIRAIDEVNSFRAPFVFLALHMEPEATVLMYSHVLRNQIEAVRIAAEALPYGHFLLVKENPKMVGTRKPAYYKELKKWFNVKLVSPEIPSAVLVENSAAVVSIAGSVTLEARLLGKPAYCFGKPPFFEIATNFGISESLSGISSINEPDKPDEGVPSHKWVRWISSTFIGSYAPTVYHPDIGKLAVDWSKENAQAYFNFINNCLKAYY